MHLYVAVKGIGPHVKQWVDDLQAIRLPKYIDGKPETRGVDEQGRPIQTYTRLAVRPIQLYEIGFPKEHLQDVANMVCPENDYIQGRYKNLKRYISWVRKGLKLKEPPKPTQDMVFQQPNEYDKAVAVIPIGIKEDIIDDKGSEML